MQFSMQDVLCMDPFLFRRLRIDLAHQSREEGLLYQLTTGRYASRQALSLELPQVFSESGRLEMRLQLSE